MRSSARKKKKLASSARLCTELALLGTLLFHGLFYLAFKPKPVQSHRARDYIEPEIVLLPPYSRWSKAWERQLYSWSILADPTLLALPHPEYGFAEIRENERILPHASAPDHSLEIPLAQETTVPELQLVGPLLPIETQVRKTWPLHLPKKVEQKPASALPSAILWRFPSGQTLVDPPSLDRDTAAELLREGPVPESYTGLEIALPEEFPRVRLVNRSGNTALDRLAQRRVRQQVFAATVAGQLPDDALSWLPDAGETVELEVEWRLVPGAKKKDSTDGGEQ